MGRGQGVKRLRQGIVRTLTPHEVARGYVYVTQDSKLPEILETNCFEVEIDGQVYPQRRIDVSGRVFVSQIHLKKIGTSNDVRIIILSRKRLGIQVLGLSR